MESINITNKLCLFYYTLQIFKSLLSTITYFSYNILLLITSSHKQENLQNHSYMAISITNEISHFIILYLYF